MADRKDNNKHTGGTLNRRDMLKAMGGVAFGAAFSTSEAAAEALSKSKPDLHDYIAFLGENTPVPDSFMGYKAHTDDEGIKQLLRDEKSNSWFVDAEVSGYNPRKPEEITPHKLLAVSPDAEKVEFLSINDENELFKTRTLPLTKDFLERNSLTMDKVKPEDRATAVVAFVDGNMVGEVIGKKFKPAIFKAGENTSIVSGSPDERTAELKVTASKNTVNLVDLSKDKDIFAKYQEEVINPNTGRALFEKAPEEFKHLADKAHATGITKLIHDNDTNVWLVEAKGSGFGSKMSSTISSTYAREAIERPSRAATRASARERIIKAPLISHKLLVLPEHAKDVEIVSKNDPKVKQYKEKLEEEGGKVTVNDNSVSAAGSMIFVDGQLLGAKRIDARTKKEIITPYALSQKDFLTVMTNKYDEREDSLEVRVGANPVKRLDLLENNVRYSIEDAPMVTPGRAGGYALDGQQETFAILHGDGKHEALLNKNQAYQTSYLGIAEVAADGLRRVDASAHFVGATVVTGGATNGSFVVHNIMSDLNSESTKSEMEGNKYTYSNNYSKDKSSSPSWEKPLGELQIKFDGKTAATIDLGSNKTPESIEHPVKELGVTPNSAADVAMQALLWQRNQISVDGRLGSRVSNLQEASVGSYTIGRFADNHMNIYLDTVSKSVGPLANRLIEASVRGR